MAKTTTAVNGLRPLNPAEKRAVELHRRGTAMRGVIIQTGLSQPQIETAIEWDAEWEKLRGQAARNDARSKAHPARPTPPPTAAEVPDVLPVPSASAEDFDELLADAIAETAVVVHVDRETGADVALPDEPEPVDWDTELVEENGSHVDELTLTPAPASGTDELLARAEASIQPRVRQLAADVRTHLAEIERFLDKDEQVRKLTDAAAVLRRHLAEYEAELAELLGPVAEEPAAKAEPEPIPAPSLADDTAASTSTMRAWAEREGWEVKPIGRLPGAIVAAFNKAHGGDR